MWELRPLEILLDLTRNPGRRSTSRKLQENSVRNESPRSRSWPVLVPFTNELRWVRTDQLGRTLGGWYGTAKFLFYCKIPAAPSPSDSPAAAASCPIFRAGVLVGGAARAPHEGGFRCGNWPPIRAIKF